MPPTIRGALCVAALVLVTSCGDGDEEPPPTCPATTDPGNPPACRLVDCRACPSPGAPR